MLKWAWDLWMLLKTGSPDACLVVGMHEEAWWKLARFKLSMLRAAKLVAGWVDVFVDAVYSLHAIACSFMNRSMDSSQDCPSS